MERGSDGHEQEGSHWESGSSWLCDKVSLSKTLDPPICSRQEENRSAVWKSALLVNCAAILASFQTWKRSACMYHLPPENEEVWEGHRHRVAGCVQEHDKGKEI